MTETSEQIATDIPSESWIDRFAPEVIRPYLRLARLDRPIGTWLLLLPCWWGAALATPAWPDATMFVLFTIGAVVMRGAGCTVNDLADRKFDARVARTATRPIASGQISVLKAFVFLALQLLLGLSILLQFNAFTVALGVSSLLLIVLYPFMKRITYWPQLFLGFTFNWGALLGWAAVKGELSAPAFVLYGAGIFWTLGYDTIYAHQDKEDDVLIGVKSTALKFGDGTKPWLVGFYSITVILLAATGLLANLAWPFYSGLTLAALHLAWQIKSVDIANSKNCLRRFKSNRDFGLILLAGIIAAQVIG
ncbi:MAG: 4-hydroxybenzoate octaprenyltransferase [Rhodospirillaceae bacterium]|jgi:4-hydroxybenzoate polyprenyltransferase|nr:MAG: 4-hydroxybenzoate octaprenyltransferase [Rhodospirillaceae bacterium]PPR73034.1 MAG: 4-hydroxybenzoate octaprenyltransferase [Alphaproteobacteria bacterium MarineAlpha3_Bin2]HIM77625.1 4-hydroxybenzoate octaprenyltransferase [Rhodospirillales bacterium]